MFEHNKKRVCLANLPPSYYPQAARRSPPPAILRRIPSRLAVSPPRTPTARQTLLKPFPSFLPSLRPSLFTYPFVRSPNTSLSPLLLLLSSSFSCSPPPPPPIVLRTYIVRTLRAAPNKAVITLRGQQLLMPAGRPAGRRKTNPAGGRERARRQLRGDFLSPPPTSFLPRFSRKERKFFPSSSFFSLLSSL